MKENSFNFSWQNLTVWITEKNQKFWSASTSKKLILQDVSGTVNSHSLVAIMGTSGVGKTTFLASLAGKYNEKEGQLLINNKVVHGEHIKNISSYVYQNDIITESLTVFEHLKFVSALKLNEEQNYRLKIIKNVLSELNLESCKNTSLKHLSGGERKRVSLAAELLNDPFILFCDEPTTGLDSCSATTIVQILKSRTRSGKLVLLTIHQPSSQLFDYFSHIILLSPGHIFYQGCKEEISNYFNNLRLYCPANYNPAEFYIKCMSNLSEDKLSANVMNMKYDNQAYVGNGCSSETHLNYFRDTKRGFYYELVWLIWRATIDTKRKIRYHLFQLGLLMVAASILSIFYGSISIEDENSVQNIKGILFFFTSELIFTHTYALINTFPGDYVICLREKPLYSTHSYFIAKTIAAIPRSLIQPLMFLAVNFIAVDFLTGFANFFQLYGILCVACISGSMLGLCISAVFSSLEYMDLFLAPFELITMLAAGIFLNLRALTFFGWIRYLSPFYYTYESLSIVYWSEQKYMDCKNDSVICYSDGKQVLEELGFYTDRFDIIWNMLYMSLLTFIIALLGYSAILYKRSKFTSY